jgi:uncharacterized protein
VTRGHRRTESRGCTPLVVEVVDSQEHLDAALPEVDRVMSGGLITMGKVRVPRHEP